MNDFRRKSRSHEQLGDVRPHNDSAPVDVETVEQVPVATMLLIGQLQSLHLPPTRRSPAER